MDWLREFFHHCTMGLAFKPSEPTPMQIAAQELVAAQKDLLEHTKLKEYYNATVPMLTKRIERLRDDMVRLSSPTQPE